MKHLILLCSLFSFLQAQNDLGVVHFVQEVPGLLYQETDMPGSKAWWIKETSILGNPEVSQYASPYLLSTQRNFQKLSGVGLMGNLEYKPYMLGFNGENGILLAPTPRYSQKSDTPQVHLIWERAAFDGNSLELNFSRKLMDSLALNLFILTQSTAETVDFRYQDITHQPYLGTLGRDSSTIPFTGRNLAFDAFMIQPALEWTYPTYWAQLKATIFSLKNAESTRRAPLQENSTTIFYEPSFIQKDKFQALSASLGGHWLKESTWEFHHHTLSRTAQEIDSSSLTLNPQWQSTQHWGTALFQITPLQTLLKLQYDSRQFPKWFNGKKQIEWELWEDNQQASLEFTHKNRLVTFTSEGAITRNSSSYDQQNYAPNFSSTIALTPILDSLQVIANYKTQGKFASVEEQRFGSQNRLYVPNKALQMERQHSTESQLQWKHNKHGLGALVRYEFVANPIRYVWTTAKSAVLPDTVAFKNINAADLENYSWGVLGHTALGNWNMGLEVYSVLFRNRPSPEDPWRTYKGHVGWNTKLVQGRLGVHLLWDFQWISDRKDYAINNFEQAYPIQIPHELLLNFSARMQILDFGLYTRIDNLNHSKRTPGAGYTPPGVTFRYGIEWILKD